MKVVVYVEGPGDRRCLETLLSPLISEKEAAGIRIQFVPMTRGDRKVALLTNAPVKAAHILMNDPSAFVVILPDLYPPNKAFPHTTCPEMQTGVMTALHRTLARSRTPDRVIERFRAFCLIHDLEVLLLAADVPTPWTKPVEEQNHHQPPKRIVAENIPGYDPIVDGARILAGVDYRMIAERCPNGFGPFVRFLESIVNP